MTTQAIRLFTLGLFAKQDEDRAGAVSGGSVDSFTGMGGKILRCTSGKLWVTLEGDPNDYFLSPNQTMAIPTLGRVAVTGKGSYRCQ